MTGGIPFASVEEVASAAVDQPPPRRVRDVLDGFVGKNALVAAAEILGRVPLIFSAGYVARTLGPSVYGSWALVLAYQGLLISVLTFGLPTSLARLASVDTAGRARGYLALAFRISSAATLAVTLVTLAVYPWLAQAVGLSGNLAWLLVLSCGVGIVTASETLLGAYFIAREMAARYAVWVLTRSSIEVTVILLVFSGVVSIAGLHGAKLLVIYLAFTAALKVLAYTTLVRRGAPALEMPPRPDRQVFVRFGLPMIPAGIVACLAAQGDRLVLGHLFDKGELGIYAFGASVAGYMTYLGSSVNALLLPRASGFHDSGDTAAVQRLFAQSQRIAIVVYGLALSLVVLFSPEIIRFTAGGHYAGAQTVLIVLGATIALDTLLGIFEWVFYLVRRPHYVLWFNIGYVVLNLTAAFVGASLGGPTAVALAILVSVAVANAVRYAFSRWLLPITLERTTVLAIAAMTALVPSLMLARSWPAWWRVGLAALLVAFGALMAWVVARGVPQSPGTRAVERTVAG